jgi:hypothetical protein
MGTIESMKMWMSFVAYSWRVARSDESGGVTDEAAMMGALAAVAIGVGLALGPWLVGKVTSINIGW